MRSITILILLISPLTVFSQDKYRYVHFNKLTELAGTEYVMATIENVGKMFTAKGKYLLFINTKNGETKQVDFPTGAYLDKIEQIKIDSLGINKVIVAAKTVNLNNSKSIDWEDPTQIIILSTDGQNKVQLTEDKLFVRTWTTNRQTGTIVVTGHLDTNNNGKYDKTDQNEILIYDLKTLKLITRI